MSEQSSQAGQAPGDSAMNPRRKAWPLLAAGTAIGLALLALDEWSYPKTVAALDIAAKFQIPWAYVQRFGSLYTTIVFSALVFCLAPEKRRALKLLWAAALAAGAATYVLQPIVSRTRPEAELRDGTENTGQTIFRYPLAKYFDDDGFKPSLPSSHATIAMANAYLFSAMFPQARVVFYALGTLCGLSRVADEDHFLADVFFGFLVGFFVARWMLLWLKAKYDMHSLFPGA